MEQKNIRELVSGLKGVLLKHRITDYLPEKLLDPLLSQLVPISYDEGYLDLFYLDDFLKTEYKVPPDVIRTIFLDIKANEDSFKVKVILPTDLEEKPAPPPPPPPPTPSPTAEEDWSDVAAVLSGPPPETKEAVSDFWGGCGG